MGQRCVGRGLMYRERLRRWISFPYCRVELTAAPMTAQRRCMHGTEPYIDWNRLPVSQTEYIPQVFEIGFPKGTSQCPCPFPGCPWLSWNCNGLRNHFNCQYWGESLRVLEEHPTLFLKCERCGSQVPPWSLRNQNYESNK